MSKICQFTLKSNKFPGMTLFCPDEPDTLRPVPGSYMFHVDTPRTVTEATKGAIVSQTYNFPAEVRSHIDLIFTDSVDLPASSAPAKVAVESDDSPVDSSASSPSTLLPEEPIALTDEDIDLIQVEISKLEGKPAAEAEPLLIATGGSETLPRAIRVKYLEMVSDRQGLPKSLKVVAKKLLEQI